MANSWSLADNQASQATHSQGEQQTAANETDEGTGLKNEGDDTGGDKEHASHDLLSEAATREFIGAHGGACSSLHGLKLALGALTDPTTLSRTAHSRACCKGARSSSQAALAFQERGGLLCLPALKLAHAVLTPLKASVTLSQRLREDPPSQPYPRPACRWPPCERRPTCKAATTAQAGQPLQSPSVAPDSKSRDIDI